MTVIAGKRRHDYDVSFRRSVKQLTSEKLCASDAVQESDLMIKGYLDDIGECPSGDNLEDMADAILGDDLRERVKSLEYGILSDSQISRISGRKSKYREVPLDVDEVDSLRFEYGDPSIYTDEINPEEYFAPSENVGVGRTQRYRGSQVSDHQHWAMSVKERDNFRCQNPNCRSRNGIMHAHHVQNYADYPERRFDVPNGVTLCERCHWDFHSTYGKSRNNGEQLSEFFGEDEITPED